MPKTRILCAHADQDGVGMHWRNEDEPCEADPYGNGTLVRHQGYEWAQGQDTEAAEDGQEDHHSCRWCPHDKTGEGLG